MYSQQEQSTSCVGGFHAIVVLPSPTSVVVRMGAGGGLAVCSAERAASTTVSPLLAAPHSSANGGRAALRAAVLPPAATAARRRDVPVSLAASGLLASAAGKCAVTEGALETVVWTSWIRSRAKTLLGDEVADVAGEGRVARAGLLAGRFGRAAMRGNQ